MGAVEKFRTPQSVNEIERLADHFAKSGLFGRGGQAQSEIVVKMIAGAENGFGPFASVQGIHVIQGRPEVGADLLARAVKESGKYDFRVREISDERCKIEFLENGESIGVSEFSMADAQKAGLKKEMYTKYPRNMLYARAMSNGVGWFCPDAVSTRMYVNGEIGGEVSAAPEVVVGEVVVEPAQPAPQQEDATIDKQMSAEDAVIVKQLAAIGQPARNKLIKHMQARGIAPSENTNAAWVDAIGYHFGCVNHATGEVYDEPRYANMAALLDSLDLAQADGEKFAREEASATPLSRQEASDRLYDDESERLADANGATAQGALTPMYDANRAAS
jgi:hypothetical protein